jgi:hypothetical protein
VGYFSDIKKPYPGLICRMEFGLPSTLSLDIGQPGRDGLRVGNLWMSRPFDEAFVNVTLNDIPLTFLRIRHRSRGIIHSNHYWTRELYIQIDCSAEMALFTNGYRAPMRLWRDRQSLFSRLPKELIRYIQFFVLVLV